MTQKKLKLHAKDCLCCGICMDVCKPRAIEMKIAPEGSIAGTHLSYLTLDRKANREKPKEPWTSYPFLASPSACDECMKCILECPSSALELS